MEPARFSFIDRLESRLGKSGFGFLTALLLMVAVSAFSHMNFITAHHGNEYTMLSQHPFDFPQDNDLQLRILSPLTGYFVFMRGPLFKYFMLFILAFFYTLVYLFFRKKNFMVTESVLATFLLGFSTLTFHQFFFPAYTDPGSYVLIILLMMFYRNKFTATLLLSLLLFNHESNIFLFPFFSLLMADGNYTLKNFLWIIIQFIIAFIPYYLYRQFIISHVHLNFTLSYYLDPGNMQWTRDHVYPNFLNGVFQAFRLVWLIPVVAIVIDIYEKRFNEMLLICSAILFVLLQFFIAYDISRLSGLAFPAIILGLLRIKEFAGTKKFMIAISLILVINFFIPSYYVGALGPMEYGKGWLLFIEK